MPATVMCEFCGDPIRPGTNGVWQFASGWIEHRQGGGANALALPERQSRWACGLCVSGARSRVPWDQPELFAGLASLPLDNTRERD